IEIIEGKIDNNEETINEGLRKLKKSVHLGFYEGVRDIISYYEEAEKNSKNLIELYKYKEKLVYYGIDN
ncbi:hypothetical protein, partial [Clostridium perfringens]